MEFNEQASLYFYAIISLKEQEIRLQNAKLMLEEFKSSNTQTSTDRHLRGIQFAESLYQEQNAFDERQAEVDDYAVDVIEDLKAAAVPPNQNERYDFEEGRYFEVNYDQNDKLKFLGPYSEN
ncbi:hypothetical protein ACFOWA_19995 [Pedobacter lithocola]|uniref:Uncharacterized protein n=1 Tax=Pedobacter lithocola TaxID=1908239 RepID=A0ABV8PGJ4_9SPHI